MAKFTLHNESGSFMNETAKTLKAAINKCKKASYKCKVMETYMAKSPWQPWNEKLVPHGREVYRNF
jgi:hypothetical protein